MIERVLEIKKTRGCAVLQLESGVLRVLAQFESAF